LAWNGQIGPVILAGLHWPQVGGILLYVMSHWLMSTIWNVISYQQSEPWFLATMFPNSTL
jgi:hypothetical protein